jgi:hypothetical protein
MNTVDADIYVYAHATAPYIRVETMKECIETVKSGKYDSAFCAVKIQDYLWKDGEPLNFDAENIPRSQDIAPTYREPRQPKSRNAPTFPGYASPDKPVRLEPGVQSEQAMKTRSAPQSKIKSIDKPAPQIIKNNAPVAPVVEEAVAEPSPAEMLMGGPEPGSGNAKGRDYLMELLKK